VFEGDTLAVMTANEEIAFCDQVGDLKCMYTGQPLDRSEEHVLAESLGGTLTSENLVCSRFNNQSSAMDKILFEPFEIITHALGIQGKKGGRRLRLKDAAGKTIELDEFHKPKVLEGIRPEIRDADGKRHVSLRGTDFDQMKKVLKTVVGADRVGAALASGSIRVEPVDVGEVSGDAAFGGAEYTAAITKTALNLVGYFESHLVRDASFLEARRLVFEAALGKKPSVDSALFCVDGATIEAELGLKNKSGVDHQVVISFDGSSGRVTASVRLFSAFDHGMILSSSYVGRSRAFIYCRNPVGSEHTDTLVEQRDHAVRALETLRRPKGIEISEDIKRAFNALIPAMQRGRMLLGIKGSIGDALPKWDFPLGSSIVSLEKLEEAAIRLSGILVKVLGVDRVLPQEAHGELSKELGKGVAAHTWKEFATSILDEAIRTEIAETWVYDFMVPVILRAATKWNEYQ